MTAFLLYRRSPKHHDIVACYTEIRFALLRPTPITFPPRPHYLLKFSLGDRGRYGDERRGLTTVGSDSVVVGPQVHRSLVVSHVGTVHEFHIELQPTALHRLCGVPLTEIADRLVDTRDVLGWRLDSLRDRLQRAGTFDGRIHAAERWFETVLERARPMDALDHVAHGMRRGDGKAWIDGLHSRSGLGQRQWRRRFIRRVGVPPKFYARVTRLDAALTLQQQQSTMNWTEIALALGYYDHSHMLRDARELLQVTPAEWLEAHPWPFPTLSLSDASRGHDRLHR